MMLSSDEPTECPDRSDEEEEHAVGNDFCKEAEDSEFPKLSGMEEQLRKTNEEVTASLYVHKCKQISWGLNRNSFNRDKANVLYSLRPC